MRPIAIPLVAALALGGCQSTQTAAPVSATARFNPAEAAYIKKTGTVSISGHAFWRDENGGVTNAAGEVIRLVPATAYARQRFAALYHGRGSIPADEISNTPVDPQYADYTRTTRAESNGRFDFDNVAPGEYFVTAQVRYKEQGRDGRRHRGVLGGLLNSNDDGGAMFETVTVTGKEEKAIKLVVTNDR